STGPRSARCRSSLAGTATPRTAAPPGSRPPAAGSATASARHAPPGSRGPGKGEPASPPPVAQGPLVPALSRPAVSSIPGGGVDPPAAPRYSPRPASPDRRPVRRYWGPRMRHSILLGIGVFVLLVVALAAGLALLLRH